MCGARPRSDNALPSFKRREVRRRVASDAPVIALDDTLDHFGPGIDQVGRDHEVVVIDDPVYLLGERLEVALDLAPRIVDVLLRTNGEPFEIGVRSRGLPTPFGSSLAGLLIQPRRAA